MLKRWWLEGFVHTIFNPLMKLWMFSAGPQRRKMDHWNMGQPSWFGNVMWFPKSWGYPQIICIGFSTTKTIQRFWGPWRAGNLHVLFHISPALPVPRAHPWWTHLRRARSFSPGRSPQPHSRGASTADAPDLGRILQLQPDVPGLGRKMKNGIA